MAKRATPVALPPIPRDADDATLKAMRRQVLDEMARRKNEGRNLPIEVRRRLVGLSRRLNVKFETLVNEVSALRAHPVTMDLPVRDGDPIRLPDVRYTIGQKVVQTILSDGSVIQRAINRWSWHPAPHELILLDENGNMEKSIGRPFCEAWLGLPVFPNRETGMVMLNAAGDRDTPQEVMVTWMLGTADDYAGLMIQRLLDRQPVTLRDLIVARLDNQAVEYRGYDARFEAFKESLEAWCVTRNLIAEDLRTSPMFDVPVQDIWGSYKSARQLANTRAESLRAAVAKALGFRHRDYGEPGWVKTVTGEQNREIIVHDTGKITIGGQFRCVIEAVSVNLPAADQVVRRMLTLASPHRTQIHTLTGDLPLLERAWPYTPAIWDILNKAEAEAEAQLA